MPLVSSRSSRLRHCAGAELTRREFGSDITTRKHPIGHLTYTLNSLAETERLGVTLATFLKPGDLIALKGDLGAGKTTLTAAIGRGLGVTDPVSSPTYTLIQEYDGPLPLFHFDPYRLDRPEEIEELGLHEYLEREGVTIIEWANRIMELLPPDRVEIEIAIVISGAVTDLPATSNEQPRVVSMDATGPRSVEILLRLEQAATPDKEFEVNV